MNSWLLPVKFFSLNLYEWHSVTEITEITKWHQTFIIHFTAQVLYFTKKLLKKTKFIVIQQIFYPFQHWKKILPLNSKIPPWQFAQYEELLYKARALIQYQTVKNTHMTKDTPTNQWFSLEALYKPTYMGSPLTHSERCVYIRKPNPNHNYRLTNHKRLAFHQNCKHNVQKISYFTYNIKV